MPIPNDMSSESSRRDVCNADLFGTDAIPTTEISSMESRLGGAVTSVLEIEIATPILNRNFSRSSGDRDRIVFFP